MTVQNDPYPSRLEGRPSIIPRADPVVYEAGGSGVLSDADVAAYGRDGFLFFESFLDDEAVAELRGELGRLQQEAGPADETVIREPESDVIRSVFDVHRKSRVCERIVRDPRILAMAEHLLGGRVYVHQSRINCKSGFGGKEFFWHSDFETWHVEDGMPRMRAVSMSIALADNIPANGPLMLIPGSHRHFVSCVGATPEDHYKTSLRRQEFGTPDLESLKRLVEEAGGISVPTGKAGSMILFDCNTMHGSAANITPYPRSNLFVVYNSVENALGPPFGGTKPRPDFIASRDFRPLTPP